MAKLSSINKNNRRRKLSDRFYAKRKKLKQIIMNKKLPLEERWSARKFEIKTVFSQVNEKDSAHHDLEWFWDAGNWDGYRQYLSSENFIQKPSDSLTSPHKHSILCNSQEGDFNE